MVCLNCLFVLQNEKIVAEDADDTTARGAAFFAGLGSVWKDLVPVLRAKF